MGQVLQFPLAGRLPNAFDERCVRAFERGWALRELSKLQLSDAHAILARAAASLARSRRRRMAVS